jgi:DNA-binding MarR family transcriptional regulator
MNGQFDSRNPLVSLVDEIGRINGRLKSVFGAARRSAELADSEMLVLNAVVEAERPPTASQIGRSLGHARQLIQRAANALMERGLIEPVPNPDHKRAALLRATRKGTTLKRAVDARADSVASAIAPALDLDGVRSATRALRAIRRQLEEQLRGEEA